MENSATSMGAAVGGVIGLFLVALVGLVIGAIAKLLVPGKDPGGWFVTILLGIGGSLFARVALALVGVQGTGFGIVGSILGAVALLLIYRAFKKA